MTSKISLSLFKKIISFSVTTIMVFTILTTITLIAMDHAYSWDPDKFRLKENNNLPHEFKILFESLKNELKTKEELMRFIYQCNILNQNLKHLKKEQSFLFVKTQIIRHVLESKYTKVQKIRVTPQLISEIEMSYANKKGNLSSFSKWILKSILTDLKEKQDLNKFAKQLNYLRGWLVPIKELSAQDFNLLTQKMSWAILEKIIERSYMFQFAPHLMDENQNNKGDFFIFPSGISFDRGSSIHEKTMMNSLNGHEDSVQPYNLNKSSQHEKQNATKRLEQISVDDLSPLSDEITNELKDKLP